jgi:hypothetical protein
MTLPTLGKSIRVKIEDFYGMAEYGWKRADIDNEKS